jgi:hypothetical protein
VKKTKMFWPGKGLWRKAVSGYFSTWDTHGFNGAMTDACGFAPTNVSVHKIFRNTNGKMGRQPISK